MSKRKEPVAAELVPPIAQWRRERQAANCVICGDSGLTDAAERWAWCQCPAGVRRCEQEPMAVQLANETLDKLAAMMGPVKRRM